MKFIQFSDLQLGTYIGKPIPLPNAAVAVYQSTLDILKALDIVLEHVKVEEPDFILIPGDIFDRTVNSRYILSGLTSRLGKLSKIAPIIIVIGNHDLIGNTSMMADWMQLPLKNIYIIDEPTILSLQAKNGKTAQFACAGWPVSILSGVTDVEKNLLNETNKGRQTFHYLINDFLQTARLSMDESAVKVFVGHGTVLDFFSDDELKHAKETINDDVVFYKNNLASYDYSAIGHIHFPKVKEKIAYAGSLYPANFGESNIDHGFLIVNIDDETKEMTHKYVPVNVRTFYNANIKTSKFTDEPSIVTHILEKFAPEKDAFIKINVIFDDPSSEIHLSIVETSLRNYYNYVIVEPVYYLSADDDFFVSSNLVSVQPGETLIQIVTKYLDKRDDISEEIRELVKIKLRSYIGMLTMD